MRVLEAYNMMFQKRETDFGKRIQRAYPWMQRYYAEAQYADGIGTGNWRKQTIIIYDLMPPYGYRDGYQLQEIFHCVGTDAHIRHKNKEMKLVFTDGMELIRELILVRARNVGITEFVVGSAEQGFRYEQSLHAMDIHSRRNL